MNASSQECHAHFDGRRLVVSNALIERRWLLVDGALHAESLFDKRGGREWLNGTSANASLALPGNCGAPAAAQEWRFEARHEHGLEVELTRGAIAYRLRVFDESAAVSMRLVAPPRSASASSASDGDDTIECLDLAVRHAQLVQVTLYDGTDTRDNLVFEQAWLPHPSEEIRLAGNLFFIEDRLTGEGIVFLKQAPLPHARPVKCHVDFEWTRGGGVRLLGHGLDDAGGEGDECATLLYRGGRAGRIAALHAYQRQVRPFDPARDGLLLSNTWGDRSKDARVCEAFMLREIEAAARLGVEVVQLDDGWQRGISGGSVVAGGRWTGFWQHDERFWEPHPERFPRGLSPVVAAAARHGLKIGLWYAPDSAGDFRNWRRDADQILRLHRAHGIDHFKIDAVKMHSASGRRALQRFFAAVRVESAGNVSLDLDITAAVRPGYFGAMREAGALFVENRYTDWHNYWPHATLRNLWQLSQYVDPLRLRMEFLNHTRNATLYEADPLAPRRYRADYLFASVMFASPLAWFEVAGLSEDFIAQVAPLVRTWKAHRRALRDLSILPVGDVPDGSSWTGFAAHDPTGAHGYLLLFRELNDRPTAEFSLPMFRHDEYDLIFLAGTGRLDLSRGHARAEAPAPLSFLLAQLSRR